MINQLCDLIEKSGVQRETIFVKQEGDTSSICFPIGLDDEQIFTGQVVFMPSETIVTMTMDLKRELDALDTLDTLTRLNRIEQKYANQIQQFAVGPLFVLNCNNVSVRLTARNDCNVEDLIACVNAALMIADDGFYDLE